MSRSRYPNSVLVVEDSYDLLEAISIALENHGFSVWRASNAADALDQLKTTRIDAVLTDLEMPGMNGLDLVRLIKEQHSGIRVILMSGWVGANRELAALAGADYFFAKPLAFSQLMTALREVSHS